MNQGEFWSGVADAQVKVTYTGAMHFVYQFDVTIGPNSLATGGDFEVIVGAPVYSLGPSSIDDAFSFFENIGVAGAKDPRHDQSAMRYNLPLFFIAPPGANLIDNANLAANHFDPFWFKSMVVQGAPWDYKRRLPPIGWILYDDFSNFNFGWTGAAFAGGIGFPLDVLLAEAGRAQREDWGSTWTGTFPQFPGSPGPRGMPILGHSPFGDNPRQQADIIAGYFSYRAYQNKYAWLDKALGTSP